MEDYDRNRTPRSVVVLANHIKVTLLPALVGTLAVDEYEHNSGLLKLQTKADFECIFLYFK